MGDGRVKGGRKHVLTISWYYSEEDIIVRARCNLRSQKLRRNENLHMKQYVIVQKIIL